MDIKVGQFWKDTVFDTVYRITKLSTDKVYVKKIRYNHEISFAKSVLLDWIENSEFKLLKGYNSPLYKVLNS